MRLIELKLGLDREIELTTMRKELSAEDLSEKKKRERGKETGENFMITIRTQRSSAWTWTEIANVQKKRENR